MIFVFLSKCESDDQVPDGVLTDAIQPAPTSECRLVELDFACAGWFVVPEVPLGTIAPILSALVALPVFKLYRRKHA